MGSFKLITPPSVEPVSLEEVKAHARIDGSTEDSLLTALIVAARQWVESYTKRALIQQSWQLWFDEADLFSCFGRCEPPCVPAYLEIPRPPLIDVTQVLYYDEEGVSTVWDARYYYLDNARAPGRLVLCNDALWPAPVRRLNGLAVDYNAGYGAQASDVPEALRLAIRQLAAFWYEQRGDAAMASNGGQAAAMGLSVPLVIQALLDPFCVRGLGA